MAAVTQPSVREIVWTVALLYLLAFGILFWVGVLAML